MKIIKIKRVNYSIPDQVQHEIYFENPREVMSIHSEDFKEDKLKYRMVGDRIKSSMNVRYGSSCISTEAFEYLTGKRIKGSYLRIDSYTGKIVHENH